MKKQIATAIILAAASFSAIAAPAAPEWVRVVASADGQEVWDGAVGSLSLTDGMFFGTFRLTLKSRIYSYYVGVDVKDCGKPVGKLRFLGVGEGEEAVSRDYLVGEGSTISALGEALCANVKEAI